MPLIADYAKMTVSPWILAGPGIAKDAADGTVSILPMPEVRMIGSQRMQLKPLVHLLVISAPILGMTSLTAENVDEWRFRIGFLEKIGANYFQRDGATFVPSHEELLDAEGIKFNVIQEPRYSFVRRYVVGLVLDVQRDYKAPDAAADDLRDEVYKELDERMDWPAAAESCTVVKADTEILQALNSARTSWNRSELDYDGAIDLAVSALRYAIARR